jgi:tol-pal system protein YbgF
LYPDEDKWDGQKQEEMMKSYLRFALSAGLIALLLTGCATRRQVQELSLEVHRMRVDLEAIRADNARLDSLFKSNIEQSRKLNADFAAYVSRLDERMQMVEARLEDAVTLINRATGAIESRAPGRTTQQQGPDSTGTDTTQASGQIDCQKVFNNAYFDFVKEDFDLARKGFQNYIKTCPNTALSDNAAYWIAESYYLQKEYARAQQDFDKLIKDYPSSEKIAAAKLKYAKSLYNQRYKTKAESYFKEIIEQYPGTDEAQEAAQMLERYK